MKYGCVACGPFVVTVQPLTDRCQSSATPSQTAAEAVSPFACASSAAAARPAISAAIVDGEKPLCSSQRSTPNAGPRAIRKFAAGLMWFAYSDASVSPSCCAIRIRYAVSSSFRGPARPCRSQAVARHRPVGKLLPLEEEERRIAGGREVAGSDEARPALVQVAREHLAVGTE